MKNAKEAATKQQRYKTIVCIDCFHLIYLNQQCNPKLQLNLFCINSMMRFHIFHANLWISQIHKQFVENIKTIQFVEIYCMLT